jgi:hypothetical protein
LKLANIHRPYKKMRNASAIGAAGQSHPIVSSSAGFIAIDRNITASAITSAFSVGPVQEVLIPTARIAFPGFDFQIVPPEGETPNEQKIAEATRGLIHSDAVVQRLKNIRLAWFDSTGYRHSFFNYSLKTEGQWTLPDVFFHMPAESFAQCPRSVMSNERYYSDPLIGGYVIDRTDNSEHFYQSQTRSGDPIEIDSETIMHISDETPGAQSVLAGAIPTIRQWSFARSKAIMGYLQRAAAPNATAVIESQYLDLDYHGAKTLGVPSELWEYLTAVIKAQSTDTAFLMPPGTKLDYPTLSIRPPIEIDQYLRREIYTHLIPTTLLDTLGNAISKSSAPALEYFLLLANGWRETCAAPYEAYDSNLLNTNGFVDYKVRYIWWEISPKDPVQVHREMVDGVINKVVTINEYRQAHDMSPLDEAGLAQMATEYQSQGGGLF